jgi:uncharacterized surface protein with fasciclin (FAS1) repeats
MPIKKQRRYLESGYAENDMLEIFGYHAIDEPQVKYSGRLLNDSQGCYFCSTSSDCNSILTLFHTVPTISGKPVYVTKDKDGGLKVNKTRIVQSDILASNGSFLFPRT